MNEYESTQELQLDDGVLRKFIRTNYRYMSLQVLMDILEVTPEYIQDVLTAKQLSKVGTRQAPSIIILHSPKEFDD